MNALYEVPWTSPNGAVKGTVFVAALSEGEATVIVAAHERWGADGYGVGNAWLVGDLPEGHPAKYARRPEYLGETPPA